MLRASRRQRPGRISLWWAAACFAAFGLLAGMVWLSRAPATSDPDLLNELESAVLVDEPGAGSADEDWPQWRGPRRDGVSHAHGLLDELGQAQEADVRYAGRRRQGASGQVDGPEAEALRQPGDEGVEDAGDHDRLGRPRLAQPPAGRSSRLNGFLAHIPYPSTLLSIW